MQKRDHAGLALVAFLIAAAGLLRNHTLLLVLLGAGAFVCVLVIVWDVSRDRALASTPVASTAPITGAQADLAAKLAGAVKVGRRLLAEAGELEPIGNPNRVFDLVRRYDAWEGSVADALAAEDDLPSEWRDAWLTDDRADSFPITRDALDRMAQRIGQRLRLIDQLLRVLHEGQR
jgi:hypothetical protein